MIKTIYSAKPHKDGYIIKRYRFNIEEGRYIDIKGITILSDQESANYFIKGIENQAKKEGFKTEIEKTQKWTFLTIIGDYTEL